MPSTMTTTWSRPFTAFVMSAPSRWSPSDHVDALGGHDQLASLVGRMPMLVDDAQCRLALGRDLGGALDPGSQRVARTHGLQPADLVDAGRAQRRARVEIVVD